MEAVQKATDAAATPPELEGKDAIARVLKAEFNEKNLKVEADPVGLKDGDLVDMHPVDTGYNARDSGKLIALNSHEMAISTMSEQEGKEIHIHYPRWNFKIQRQKKETGT